jgi:hypothetical protein
LHGNPPKKRLVFILAPLLFLATASLHSPNVFVSLALAQAAPATQSSVKPCESPIRFAYEPIDFKLESSETPQRYAPETMAGEWLPLTTTTTASWIFFTNGADIETLKSSTKIFESFLRTLAGTQTARNQEQS